MRVRLPLVIPMVLIAGGFVMAQQPAQQRQFVDAD
jgi:hypothetical protein